MIPSPTPILLDSNALIALTAADHLAHRLVRRWITDHPFPFATCPITQGALLRFHLRLAPTSGAAVAHSILEALEHHPRHRFWADDLPYSSLRHLPLRGHQQVTDFYLASLAVAKSTRLLTLDRSLAAFRPDACLLLE